MNLGIYSYAATVFVFTGLAILLYAVRHTNRPPRTYWKTILLVAAIMVPATAPAEGVALMWRTWMYDPSLTLHTTFLGAEVETYLFTLLVTVVVGLATLSGARREDARRTNIL